ncbi:MAG TPA: PAS domain S-box protein, partial [Ktedonobacterales bacterium]|nr:PAS domain S-box protein [Ktedonobacterales bacterium]
MRRTSVDSGGEAPSIGGHAKPDAVTAGGRTGAARRDARGHATKPAAEDSQFAAMFAAIADGVIFYDREGNIVRTNPAFRSLLGFDAHPEYSARSLSERRRMLMVRDENGVPLPEGEWVPERVLRGEVLTGASVAEFFVHSLDGRDLLLQVSGAPVRDQEQRIVGGVLILRDITERRQLERRAHEATQAAEARASQFEAIVETIADGVLVFDREGR